MKIIEHLGKFGKKISQKVQPAKLAERPLNTHSGVLNGRPVATGVLAGIPPLRLMAAVGVNSYWELRSLRDRVENFSSAVIFCVSEGPIVAASKEILQGQQLAGRRTLDAIVPVLKKWVSRKHGQ